MNNRDRRLLERVYKCLAIPFGAMGTQSSSMAGVCRFHADMQHALPKARELMSWIATGEPWEDAIEESLQDLERWFSERLAANWK